MCENLYRAIDNGDINEVMQKLQAIKNEAFIRAVFTGKLEIVQLLLHEGADIYTNDNDAFYGAVESNFINIVKLLLPSYQTKEHSHILREGLGIAACEGYTEMCSLFLELGINVTEEDLECAIVNEHVEIVALFMSHIDISDNAMVIAARSENLEILKLLLQYGGNVNAHDNFAIKFAISHDNSNMVELLLEFGATVNEEMLENVPSEKIRNIISWEFEGHLKPV